MTFMARHADAAQFFLFTFARNPAKTSVMKPTIYNLLLYQSFLVGFYLVNIIMITNF